MIISKKRKITVALAVCCMGFCVKALAFPSNDARELVQMFSGDEVREPEINWEYEELSEDSTALYYLYNLSAKLFLRDDNTLSSTTGTLWRVGKNEIVSTDGRYLSLTSQNTGSLFQPNWVCTASSSSAQSATSIIEACDSTYYVIGNNVNISLLQRQSRYFAVVDDQLTATINDVVTPEAQWLFVSIRQFEEKTADIDMDALLRSEAIARLADAIQSAEEQLQQMEAAPAGSKTALQTAITTAKVLKSNLDRGGFLANLVSNDRIAEVTQTLLDAIAQTDGISDYYQACLEEIANAESLGDAVSLRTIVTAAKSGVEMSVGLNGMKTVMTTMHYALVAYLQGVDSLTQNQDLTCLIRNHSFDTGNMDGWTGVSVNMQNINIGSFNPSDFSSLANAIEIGMQEGTRPVACQNADSIGGVHGKYYLSSDNGGAMPGQPIAQLLMGLPAGSYQLSANMAVASGLFNSNSNYLSVITLPYEVVQQFLGNIDLSHPDWSQIADSLDIKALASVLLEKGKVMTGKSGGININTLSEVSVSFDLEKNDLVLLVANAGLYPIAGTNAYRADDFKLHYLHAPVVVPDEIIDCQTSVPSVSSSQKGYDLNGRPAKSQNRGIVIREGRKMVSK